MRREGLNNCRGWRHLVEEAYETDRGNRKEKRKMNFSVEGACRHESNKIARREGQSEEEDDVHDEEGRNISGLKRIFRIINKTTSQ